MPIINKIFLLLVVLHVKHFLADYPLQGSYMLGKFKGGTDWILPLVAHCAVHFVFTLGLVLCVNPALWWLASVDFVAHFIMDRIKASPNLLGRFKALSGVEYLIATRSMLRSNTYFWWSLGLDQMVHHLTDLFVVWRLVI